MMGKKSALALELQRIWETHGTAWHNNRAGWGTSSDEKDAKGFWVVSEYEHVTMKKGSRVPKIPNKRRKR